jgi:hypothetical protein
MKKSSSKMFYGSLSQLSITAWGYFWFDSSLQEYKDISEEAMNHFHDIRNNLENYTFDEIMKYCAADLELICSNIGFIDACLYEQWRMFKLFKPEDNAEEYLQKLQMDLPGNPTSRMGRFMRDLAAFDDIQTTDNGEEISKKQDGGVSVEFKEAYDIFFRNSAVATSARLRSPRLDPMSRPQPSFSN